MACVWGAIGSKARSAAQRKVQWNTRTAAACVFLAGQSIALVVAVLYTTVANVTCVQQLAPVFCALGDKIAGDTLPSRTITMIVVALLGVGILFGGEVNISGRSTALGLLFAMGNPVCWACYWYILRKRRGPNKPPMDETVAAAVEHLAATEAPPSPLRSNGNDDFMTVEGEGTITADNRDVGVEEEPRAAERIGHAVPYLVVSGVICGVAGAAGGTNTHLDNSQRDDMLYYFLFGGVCLPVAQVLFTVAPSLIPAAEIACVKCVEVIVAPLLVYFYDGETPTWNTYVGGFFILVAVLGHSAAILWEQQKKRDPSTTLTVVNPMAA